jgi:hypothetical protein
MIKYKCFCVGGDTLKYCNKCGAQQSDTRFFCVDCGEKLGRSLDEVASQAIKKETEGKINKLYNCKDRFYVSLFVRRCYSHNFNGDL